MAASPVTYDDFLQHFGEQIMLRRRRLRISQEALAELTHLSRSSISEIERGKANPSLTTVLALALALDLMPSVLMREMDPLLSTDDRERLMSALRKQDEAQ